MTSNAVFVILLVASLSPTLAGCLSPPPDDEGGRRIPEAELEVLSSLNVGFGAYMARVSVGTPPRHLFLLLDTSTSVSWLQCQSCATNGSFSSTSSSSGGCYPQLHPLFDPSASSSYAPITCSDASCSALIGDTDAVYARRTCNSSASHSSACSYALHYSYNDSVAGDMARDTIYLGGRRIHLRHFAFGCASAGPTRWIGVDGVLALGLGPAGVPAQTVETFGGRFVFCLPTIYSLRYTDAGLAFLPRFSSARGFLRLGTAAETATSTPLLSNEAQPFSYVVWLRGLAVGGRLLRIPELEARPPTNTVTNNTLVTTGFVVTLLAPPIYEAVRDAFTAAVVGVLHQVPPPPLVAGIFDTCFNYGSIGGRGADSIPLITFIFDGGLTLTPPLSNVLFPVDLVARIVCLALMPTGGANYSHGHGGWGLNAIGAFQLQGFVVAVDTVASTLSVVAATTC